MAISPKMEIKQGQSLVMTPQLQQAIKLLQFSQIELNEYIEQELEKNPLLERKDSESMGGETEPAPADTSPSETSGLDEALQNNVSADAKETAAVVDTEVENIYPEDSASDLGMATDWSKSGSGSGSGGRMDQDDLRSFEETLSEKQTLKNYLSEQLSFSKMEPAEKLVGAHLIDLVDANGYLLGELDYLAGQLGLEMAFIENVRQKMRAFEPTGVFARSVAECLSLQLADEGLLTEEMEALLENLEKLARHEFKKLQNICQVDETGLMQMVGQIKKLNPRPGDQFEDTLSQPIIPDVFVMQNSAGGWNIRLNSDALPKVLVNQEYYKTISADLSRKEEKEYVSNCMQEANWLTKSLDQRARTILKVTEEIVRQQDRFLTEGIAYLRPLNLKTVAEAVGMHESTISRVTSNKYMATERGNFELKFFFTSSIASSDSEDAYSSESVKHRIKILIDDEDVKKVLSDDKIVSLLQGEGIDIARRTVAKYREAMHIPSSVQRRREKKAAMQMAGY